MATLRFCLPNSFICDRKFHAKISQKIGYPSCFIRQHICSSEARNVTQAVNDRRPSANFQPNTWDLSFLESLKNDALDETQKDRAKKLVEEVKCMINNEDAETLTTLELLDDIRRLGLGYKFGEDMKKSLDRFASLDGNSVENNLHFVALRFRLLRQHGYDISQDVFKNFKDHEGNFKTSICNDVKGMLSLYEASYLAFDGETVLDEARAFTKLHLNCTKLNIGNNLKAQVQHSLELPHHYRMVGLEARLYLEAYSKREDANPVLLELAKIEFNVAQSILQRDLRDMSRWWESMGISKRLNFVRDRIMESFFWAVGMTHEPQFSKCRKVLTKAITLLTTIDDIYDVYGTLDELELFTHAVERWDLAAFEELPNYMKFTFLALYNTVNEIGYEYLKENDENIIPCLKKAWIDMCKTFLQEAKWHYNKEMPTFEDYMDKAWMSSSGPLLLVHAYFFSTPNISKEMTLLCLEKYHEHDHFRRSSIIFRLANDLVSSEGETINTILCYMNDTGFSEEISRQYIKDLIEKTWKEINEDQKNESPFGNVFKQVAINLARNACCTYQYGDGYGAPDVISKNRVNSLLIQPFHT